MYKKSSEFQRHAADVLGPKQMPPDSSSSSSLSLEEKRAALSRVWKSKSFELSQLKEQMKHATNRLDRRRIWFRIDQLGEEIQKIQDQIHTIRPKRKTGREVMDFYVTAVRELYGDFAHSRVMDRAVELYEANKSAQGE